MARPERSYEFLTPMQAQLDKPRQRFLQQAVRGIVLSGTLVVMELCRWIKDNYSDCFYQDKRLLHHLVSPRADLNRAVTAYRQRLARVIEPDTPLIIDLTDLAKPRAKKMKYLALARDGSEDRLVKGMVSPEFPAILSADPFRPRGRRSVKHYAEGDYEIENVL